MKRTITFSFLILFLMGPASVFAQNILVLDHHDHKPVINAHILSSEDKLITTTDLNGVFELKLIEGSSFKIRSIGYGTTEFRVDEIGKTIYLHPQVLEMNTELIVEAANEGSVNIHSYHQHDNAQSMDEFLGNVDGMNVIQRGAFAWEPMVRGQADQRMNLTIDGVPVFKACVDKMDPITSYVEINNLSKLEIDKNGTRVAENGNGNASVNLITQKAQWKPLEMDLETGFQAPNMQQIYRLNLNGSDRDNKHAFRLSGAYRKSGDLVAGNSTTIENTQFEKLNLNVHYRHQFNSKYNIEANYITDKAYDVGYPALLMDATQALADIGRVQFNISGRRHVLNLNSVVLYANMIRHSMDDYDRDVANRNVMRGMYMPMYGETKTFGGKLNGTLTLLNTQSQWFFDAFSSEAFGDMKMQSLDPNIEDMLIYNMDEIFTRQASIGFKHQFQLSDDLNLKVEESLRFKHLETQSESHASLFEGIYGRDYEASQSFLFSASGTLLWMLNEELSISNSVVYSERMGNHMETLGHYVYNYTDGYFYDGNPWLKKERSVNYEAHAMWKKNGQSVSLTGFTKFYSNYIDGIISEDISNNNFRFKRYSNVGDALMLGGELRVINRLGDHITLENRLSYLYAQNTTLDEPLPLIPPLNGVSMIGYSRNDISMSLDVNWASAQERIAENTSVEDETDAYVVLGMNLEKRWMDNRLSTSVKLNNITDEYYHRHTSIGNIPESGFNVMFTAKLKLDQF
jgi:iron complex outermembrane receptor protein